jgi:hypothetical protein
MTPTYPADAVQRTWATKDRSDFAFKAWTAAAAFVTAIITTFLLLSFLSPDVNIDVPGVQAGAGVNGD